MSEDQITIHVDGQAIQTRKGAMLIEATDQAGIYIPRFCYHEKLSIAANCRMCLVEVERAPKPVPACATPVMDGMKVFTRSEAAVKAQRATMEFLLINHPLDCPICDQGGECELQDLALGYGADVSRYSETKRVVRDQDVGPLIQMDMTRCIHCTRCVRFGEEIAGVRELGATGRGEHMEIGTYVERAMVSELSGNAIDLCPVGALTSKPYRYSARAWELRERDSVAPHDCVGSNVHVHVKGQTVKRVVPKRNEAVNETWIADRDRFSYEGLNSERRLRTPRIKTAGVWADCDWDTALQSVASRLEGIAGSEGGQRIGALVSPSSTTEEFYLLQRLLRELGSHNIDHRLREVDFADQDMAPVFPGLGMTLDALEQADAVLLVGAFPRYDQPLVNQRLRKAARKGAKVMAVDSIAAPFNLPLLASLVVGPSALGACLAGIAKALAAGTQAVLDDHTRGILDAAPVSDEQRRVAACLRAARNPVVLFGNTARRHAARSRLRALCGLIATLCDGRLGHLTEGANAAGAWLAGAVPHRGPGRRELQRPGLDAAAMVAQPLSAYVLVGIEPDLDCRDGLSAMGALRQAQFVVAVAAFEHPALEEAADVLLPMALFAENEGSYVNVAGVWQSFDAAVAPPGDARPAWKILRVLGERLGLPGFDAVSCGDLTREIKALTGALDGADRGPWVLMDDRRGARLAGLDRLVEIPMYAVDALVRHAPALNRLPVCGDDYLHLSPATMERLGLADAARVEVGADGARVTLAAVSDPRLPDDTCMYYGARPATAVIDTTGCLELRGVQ